MPDTQGNWTVEERRRALDALRLRVAGTKYSKICEALGFACADTARQHVFHATRFVTGRSNHGRFSDLVVQIEKALAAKLIMPHWPSKPVVKISSRFDGMSDSEIGAFLRGKNFSIVFAQTP